MIYLKENYDISSRGEITSKKSSSFLRGPRVPIMLIAFPLWTVIEIAGIHAIPIIFMCILHGTFCDTGIPCISGVYRRSIFKIRPNILIGLQKIRLRPKDRSRS